MRLGVDFGTAHTVAVFSRSDGRTEALLFDSSPLLPSAVFVDWVGTRVSARDATLWNRLAQPATTPDRRHRRALWDDARSVKELLSRASTAGVAVPLYDVDLVLVTFWERSYGTGGSFLIRDLYRYYWLEIVYNPDVDLIATLHLVVILAVALGVAVPSFVRAQAQRYRK